MLLNFLSFVSFLFYVLDNTHRLTHIHAHRHTHKLNVETAALNVETATNLIRPRFCKDKTNFTKIDIR